jgi:putative hydrolase of the HAD superfamily
VTEWRSGKRIVVFDLDDTLYPEIEYVRSGFRAVAFALEDRFDVHAEEAFALLWRALQVHGRGKTFDRVLEELGVHSRAAVRSLVDTYRGHVPELTLPAESRRVLERLSDRPLYLVSDGHKGVQARKLAALGIEPCFRHCYLTNRYGIARQKPSPHVFQLLVRREGCDPGDVVYVGDDPHKDFCGIRPLGFRTLRVRTGRHAHAEVAPERDAEASVEFLARVPERIERWERTS